jgi:F-type H+-transporting ATPase subunit gamma
MAGKTFAIALALLATAANGFVPGPSFRSGFAGQQAVQHTANRRIVGPVMGGNERELRSRIESVSNTRKITEAMRLVAAAKVRRAQQAVLATRPFSETLQSVFSGLITRLGSEAIDLPLLETRDVKKVTLVVMSGDRGLCGGYNSFIIKKTEARIKELASQGIAVELVTIGKKCVGYFRKRDTPVLATFDIGQAPTAEEASKISDLLLSNYLAGETDCVEIMYTQFVSLIASNPSVRTMLPLSPSGIETEGDEVFQLTTKDGQFSVESESKPPADAADFPKDMIFEQDPLQILNAILPLYINGQMLRMLQESVASELAARMQAMQAASDNAKTLKTDLSREYNRARQAAVTQQIMEIVAGASAANE